ncbi:MAG: site-2 protease family protein [Acidobacteriota bacterium]|nr:site-2 protease family protein [Acidobacteriota bacterium]
MSYALALLGFAVLILLHEAGHFVAAKAVGMRVERFSLFFGPMIVKRQIGETEYGIGVFPFGGYNKITGMSPEEEFETPEIAARAYVNQPVWKRIVVIAAGPGVNLVLAVILGTVALIGLGAHLVTDSHGQPVVSNQVAAVVRGSAAQGVLKAGDRIVSVDGLSGSYTRLDAQIAKHTCAGGAHIEGCRATTAAQLVVRRDGALKQVAVRPRWSAAEKKMLVGFRPYVKTASNGLWYSAGRSVSLLWQVTERTATAIAEIFKPQERKQLHSIVGATQITAAAIASGWVDGIWLLAQISLALALINLLPFLPLDGGHIFWAIAEKVRGRRISVAVIERASLVGIALLALLLFVGFSNDISALTGNGLGT